MKDNKVLTAKSTLPALSDHTYAVTNKTKKTLINILATPKYLLDHTFAITNSNKMNDSEYLTSKASPPKAATIILDHAYACTTSQTNNSDYLPTEKPSSTTVDNDFVNHSPSPNHNETRSKFTSKASLPKAATSIFDHTYARTISQVNKSDYLATEKPSSTPADNDLNHSPSPNHTETNQHIPPSNLPATNIHGTNFMIVDVPKDGNCFFHCLSFHNHGDFTKSTAYRRAISTYVYNNWDQYHELASICHAENITSQNYLQKLQNENVWATACEVKAAAVVLEISIDVKLQGWR